MGRRSRIPDGLKKHSLPISLSQYVIDSLKKRDNKSEIVEEILLENMDRINDGDINAAINARDIQVRSLIAKALMEEKGTLLEMEETIKGLQELLHSLQEVRRVSELSLDDAKGVAQLISKLEKKLDSNSFQESLVESICKRIYEETEKYARDTWSI